MAKISVRSAEGEFLASYANLSEVNTYILHSFPGAKTSQPKGNKAQTLTVKNDEGKEVAYIDLPATDKGDGDSA